jgi:hypothetical protein
MRGWRSLIATVTVEVHPVDLRREHRLRLKLWSAQLCTAIRIPQG